MPARGLTRLIEEALGSVPRRNFPSRPPSYMQPGNPPGMPQPRVPGTRDEMGVMPPDMQGGAPGVRPVVTPEQEDDFLDFMNSGESRGAPPGGPKTFRGEDGRIYTILEPRHLEEAAKFYSRQRAKALARDAGIGAAALGAGAGYGAYERNRE